MNRRVFWMMAGLLAAPVAAWPADSADYSARNKGSVPADCLGAAKTHLDSLEKSDKGIAKARKGLEGLVARKCSDSLIEARIGLAYLGEDEVKARAHLSKAAETLESEYPANRSLAVATLFNLAYLTEEAGALEDAERLYRRTLALDHGYANARTSLQTLYQKRAKSRIASGETDGALKDIDSAIAEAEVAENDYGFTSRAVREQLTMLAIETLAKGKRGDAALPYLDRLAAEKNTRALMKAAGYFRDGGDRNGQEKVYEVAFEADSTQAEPVLAWGELYENEGKPDQAAEIYRKALARGTRLPQVKYSLGVILFNQGQLKEGAALVEEAATELPRAAEYQETLAEMKAAIR